LNLLRNALAEIVFDFYDKLKAFLKGYASFDYHYVGYKQANLVRLDILLNGDMVDALSSLIHGTMPMTSAGKYVRN